MLPVPGAGVGHDHYDAVSTSLCFNQYVRTSWRMTDGILDEVGKEEGQQLAVSMEAQAPLDIPS